MERRGRPQRDRSADPPDPLSGHRKRDVRGRTPQPQFPADGRLERRQGGALVAVPRPRPPSGSRRVPVARRRPCPPPGGFRDGGRRGAAPDRPCPPHDPPPPTLLGPLP